MIKIDGSKLIMTRFTHYCDQGYFKYFVLNHEHVAWNNTRSTLIIPVIKLNKNCI
jgi:hypothetical protein